MNISEITIAAIKNLAPEILASRGVLSSAKDRKSYVCPNCGNGTGKSGDGLAAKYENGVWLYKCFSCGAGFDNVKLLASHYNLDSGRDFNEICRRACDDFSINADFEPNPSAAKNATSRATSTKVTDPAELERNKKETAMIRADILAAQANLDDLPVEAMRGLTFDTYRHFRCGYLTAWQSPAAILDGKNPPPSRRLIVPTSDSHYLASAIDRDKVNKKWHKMHAGTKEIFNSTALTAEGVIVVVEGEIDCMSIWQATDGKIPVIAIGGAAEDNWMDSLPEKAQFLILFDNDDTGKRDSKTLRDELIYRGYPAAVAFLSDGDTKIDANDIIRIAGGAVVLADKVNALVSGAQANLDKAAAEIKERQALEEKKAEWVANNGEIDPAEIERLKSDVKYLAGLTVEDITSTVAQESKTLRAIARCRFYDFRREVADNFMARVKTAKAQATAKVKKATAESPVDDSITATAMLVPSKIDTDVDLFVSEIRKAHKRYQYQKQAERDVTERKKRHAERQRQLADNAQRLEELKALPPSTERDDEMRTIIADMCDWYIDKQGNKVSVKGTAANYNLIFQNDPVINGLIGYDEFQQSDVPLKHAPWKKKFVPSEPWQDSDDSALRMYLRDNYTDISTALLYDDVVSVYSRKNSFHAVQDWLERLPAWDGKERAASIFIDYLRAEDNAYTREVTTNWLFGALARIFYPGCEYQTALVLNGAQGIGKSGITKMLGGKWHVALKDSVEDSHAVDVIQNGWIVEIEEFWAGSRAEINALKAFISANADDRRAAYARRAQKSLRHCAFVVTCNDEKFLKDVTGNRRFMIIKCNAPRHDSSAIKALTQETLAQIWAEVLFKFRQQFPDDAEFNANKLELSDAARVKAEEIAQEHMVDDGIQSEIQAYLDIPIPPLPIWRSLSKEQRRKFFVDGCIELEDFQWKACRARLRTKVERKQFDEALAKGDTFTVNFPSGYKEFRRFVGSHIREYTFAAEICNEYFKNDNRKFMLKISEYLSVMNSWQKGARLRNEPAYGNQLNVYYRTGDADYETSNDTDNDDWEIGDGGVPF